MLWWLTWLATQLPPGVETRSLIVGQKLECPGISQSSICDDPTIVLPTVEPSGALDKVVFVGKKPGRTTCSCGMNRGFRFVFQITVVSPEEATESDARKIVESALTRLYTPSPKVP